MVACVVTNKRIEMLVAPPCPSTLSRNVTCNSLLHCSRVSLSRSGLLQQGVRFDPDLPQTIRLEFAKSNTKVSKPKQVSPVAATTSITQPQLVHPLTGRKQHQLNTDLVTRDHLGSEEIIFSSCAVLCVPRVSCMVCRVPSCKYLPRYFRFSLLYTS